MWSCATQKSDRLNSVCGAFSLQMDSSRPCVNTSKGWPLKSISKRSKSSPRQQRKRQDPTDFSVKRNFMVYTFYRSFFVSQDKPLVLELVLTFELLRNFMLNQQDVKVAAYECGLSDLVHRLWAWCQVESSLMTSVLHLLATYIARCPQGMCFCF